MLLVELVNQEKKSHDRGVGTSQNLSLYLLINSFHTQKYIYRKSIFLYPIHSEYPYMNES